jgi:hypothetical protein
MQQLQVASRFVVNQLRLLPVNALDFVSAGTEELQPS